MTSKKLKKVSENDNMQDSDNSSGDDSSDSEMVADNEELLIDFEGRNPTDSDFNGIKQLLHQLFLSAPINLTELTNTIISQDYIGSVIKQAYDDDENMEEDDDDDGEDPAFGVTTVINLTSRKETKFVEEIKQLLLSKAEKFATDSTLKLIKNALSNDSVSTGLIINERYVNIPAQISVPMLENLCKEVKRAVDKNKPYNFGYYIMPLKFHRKEGNPVEDLYSNPEEELFLKESLANFEFSVEEDTGVSGKMTQYRKIVILDGKKFPEIVATLADYIAGNI